MEQSTKASTKASIAVDSRRHLKISEHTRARHGQASNDDSAMAQASRGRGWRHTSVKLPSIAGVRQ